jgi:hypothetical protein
MIRAAFASRSPEAEPSSEPSRAAELSARFLAQLACSTDGIGWVHVLEQWRRHGVVALIARAGAAGIALGDLAAQTDANLGYLAVMCRVLDAQGWLWREVHPQPARTRVGPTPAGAHLLSLIAIGPQTSELISFLPIARNMGDYLAGRFDPPAGAPSLAQLARWSRDGWDLPRHPGARHAGVERLEAALDGNLLGPVAVAAALGAPPFDTARAPDRRSYLGRDDVRRFVPDGERQHAALDVLAKAGWASWRAGAAELTELGAYALRRALAFGVPVSYLPLFDGAAELCFGDAEHFWQRGPTEPERHVDRALNVRASGASHARYFAATDPIIGRLFDLPFAEQPLGFCDMGSGDGAWLEHAWRLIESRTERGRLMRAFPRDERYRPVLVGVDYNAAAREATRARLERAGIPHLVLPGSIDDPDSLRAELARRGIDCRRLLHGNSFIIHNRPFSGVRDPRATFERRAAREPAYAWRGRALPNRDVEQNLVELFAAWRSALGPSGMIAIELHDPEHIIAGKTLASYILTHGLSDQLTVGVAPFLRAAAEAGLAAAPETQRFFPEPREVAAISVSHFVPR